MNQDLINHSMISYGLMLPTLIFLIFICKRTHNILISALGNIISFIASYLLVNCSTDEKWSYYFKAFTSIGLLIFISTAHHTLYDCLICQRTCPMNYQQVDNIIECISFTEEETNMLLDGKPIDTFSKAFKTKMYMLGINEWYEEIPRNLKTLFEV